MMKIALTGGIAEGKTTVLRMLNEHGLSTGSADEIAADVMSDPAVQEEVAAKFGIQAPLNRDELADTISRDPKNRRELNLILHPEILLRLMRCEADVIEVPLLLETCLQGSFKRTWVVTCGSDEQLRRLEERLGSKDEARARIATQLPSEVKCAFADRIIRTDRPIESVIKDVRKLALEGTPS